MKPKAILFHAPQMEDLAKRICKFDKRITLGKIDWKRFEDGFPNIYIEKQRAIRRTNVAFLASFDTQGDIFEQLSAVMALTRGGAQLFKIILPYFPTGTMERVDDEGQVATAKTLARFMSATPICGAGPAEIVMYDIHALQLRFYFGDNVVPRLKSSIKYLKAEISKMKNIAIVFPDFGARKRFGKMFEGYEQIVCEKIRGEGDKRTVTIAEGDPRGRHCIIVDDIFKTCGTIMSCKDVLVKAGAKKISAFGTHANCPQDAWLKFIDSGFTHVWVSDSCPLTIAKIKAHEGEHPFIVLSLDESIARVIVDEDEPLKPKKAKRKSAKDLAKQALFREFVAWHKLQEKSGVGSPKMKKPAVKKPAAKTRRRK